MVQSRYSVWRALEHVNASSATIPEHLLRMPHRDEEGASAQLPIFPDGPVAARRHLSDGRKHVTTASMPRILLPAMCQERQPGRVVSRQGPWNTRIATGGRLGRLLCRRRNIRNAGQDIEALGLDRLC